MSKRNAARVYGKAARLFGGALLVLVGTAWGGAPAPGVSAQDSDAALLGSLRQLRDVFLERIDEEGYKLCPAPKIELGDPPSFGQYLPERNTVVIGAWSHLASHERQGFEAMAQSMGGQASARSVFENGTNRWVFVHELAHWWQTCRHMTRKDSYGEDNGANRIALAFWRERDARFATGIVQGFTALWSSMPSPVPAGESPQSYLDANFAKLAHGDTYTWFQGEMIRTLALESPVPSFHKALSQPLYPW